MFKFIIVTDRATPEVDNTIKMLLNSKTVNDDIIVINNHQYNLKYRSQKGIKYIHCWQPKIDAINNNLPKDSNVVLLDNDITITKSFVRHIYGHYNFKEFSSLRIDTSLKGSGDISYIKSDSRIGSVMKPESFKFMAMVFNTGLIPKIGNTPKDTASKAVSFGMNLNLLDAARVIKTGAIKKKSNGVTIFIPSIDYKYSDDIKRMMNPNDEIYEFKFDERTSPRFINNKIVNGKNSTIILVNPKAEFDISGILDKIRDNTTGRCSVYKANAKNPNIWLSFPKEAYKPTSKTFYDIKKLQDYILSYKSCDEYIDEGESVEQVIKPKEKSNINNGIISIIIPFCYNGDRWPLFNACIDSLYNHTKDHSNIEIVIHEAAPERYIKDRFIEKYDLVYIYSKYEGLFHRSWVLNLPARFIASGDTFVFFDGDLIVNKRWVNELRKIDRTKLYVGWGSMTNLNKKGTHEYLKNNKITTYIERVRKPSPHAAAGGINIIPKDVFFGIGGWPESYKDKGYGGDDNSFAFKIGKL